MQLRDYTFLGTARSVCPHCRRGNEPENPASPAIGQACVMEVKREES
jgi:hypothetical protein